MSISFRTSISKPGRNLILAIILGLVVGGVAYLFGVEVYLIQVNALVERGWIVPLFTSIFVAPPILEGFLDVAFNALSVFFLDSLLSAVYTDRQYYATFLGTAVFGNVLSLLYGPGVASFGASGGIFGLIAGALAFDYAYNRRVNLGFVGWFVFVLVYSSLGGADVFAHLGGALAGLPVGYYLGSKRRSTELRGAVWRYYP